MASVLRSAPWIVQAGADGRYFGCHFGTVTTPLATPATTAITAARPQAWLRVPNGTLIIPTSVRITVEATGITTQGEISLVSTTNDVGNGTSSAGTSGPLNKNTGSSRASACTQRQLATGDVTTETGLLEHVRFSFAASAVNQLFNWPQGEIDDHPILRGPATWALYIGGNAVNFFASFSWVELDEAAI